MFLQFFSRYLAQLIQIHRGIGMRDEMAETFQNLQAHIMIGCEQ